MAAYPVDIRALGAAIKTLTEDAATAYAAGERPGGGDDTDIPPTVQQALDQFLSIAYRLDEDAAAGTFSSQEISRFGDHGLTLLQGLGQWLTELGLADGRAQLNGVLPSLAVWVARRGGELDTLEPVVDALAKLANETHDPSELAVLADRAGEIMGAAAPAIRQDLEKGNPGRPWRVLNINRAIMATRSHDPRLMDNALKTLVANLPEEAPRFFAEGMQQIDALDYPPEVRVVMQRYYDDWSARTLH
jgi:hypothetical protein